MGIEFNYDIYNFYNFIYKLLTISHAAKSITNIS